MAWLINREVYFILLKTLFYLVCFCDSPCIGGHGILWIDPGGISSKILYVMQATRSLPKIELIFLGNVKLQCQNKILKLMFNFSIGANWFTLFHAW